MANQAIALGIRAPQPIDLGAATARFGNVMSNMAVADKQRNDMARANQLRGLVASGVDIMTPEGFNQVASLDPQAAAALRKSAEETSAAKLKRETDIIIKHRNRGVAVNDQGTWDMWVNGLEADDAASAAQFRAFMGPTFDPAKMDRILTTAEQYIDKNIATARTDVQLDEQGNPAVVHSGGLGPDRIIRPKTYEYADTRGGTGGPLEPAPTESSVGGDRSSRLSADLASPLLNVKSDGDYQTALMLIKRASPEAAAQLKQIMPVFNPAMMDDIRAAARAEFNTVPQPQSIAGGARGGMGGPDEGMSGVPMRASSTQSGMVSNLGPEGLVETTPFRAKNPMQAPAPGVNIQPLPRIAGQAAAEESGRQGVRVTTDPLIKGKEERVVRVEKLRGELPKAHAQTSTLINSLTDRINAIDEFLRNPYRNTIVGSIEGRIPKLFQNERRSDAQAQWDFITNNSVLDKLIQDRQSTETGASPQGLVSDRDLGVAASAANRLTQTGSEAAQEDEMKRLRSILYRTRESALRGYTNTYREVLDEDKRFRIAPPSVSPAYTGPRDTKRTKSGAIVKNW